MTLTPMKARAKQGRLGIYRPNGLHKILSHDASMAVVSMAGLWMQVVEPKVRAYLYTWGGGRVTAEGEFIPVRSEELDIGYIDGML